MYKTLPGQLGEYDRNGNARQPTGVDATVDPRSTTVGTSGGGGFNPWQRGADGQRVWAPDGVPRDRISGEPLALRQSSLTAPEGPQRSFAHEEALRHAERMFPIRPMRVADPDADDD
jgi:hypothetical protein